MKIAKLLLFGFLSITHIFSLNAQCYEIGFDVDGDGVSEVVTFNPDPMDLVENGGVTVSTITFCNTADEIPNDPSGNSGVTICASKLTFLSEPTGTYGDNFEWTQFVGCWIGTIPEGSVTPAGCGTIEVSWVASEDSDEDNPENCVVFNLQPAGIVSGNACFDPINDAANGCTYTASIELDVQLTSFTVVKNATVSELNWSTSSETNNAKFEIERSSNAVSFDYIGEVVGNGTSIREETYQFVDRNPLKGTNYYRLKQVDFDASSSYSEIRSVNFSDLDKIPIYPNPVADFVIINSDLKKANLKVFDVHGKLIVKTLFASNEAIDISYLVAGTYLFQIENLEGNVLSTSRIIVSD